MVVTKIDNMASYSTYTGKPKIFFPKKVRIKHNKNVCTDENSIFATTTITKEHNCAANEKAI